MFRSETCVLVVFREDYFNYVGGCLEVYLGCFSIFVTSCNVDGGALGFPDLFLSFFFLYAIAYVVLNVTRKCA